MNLRNVKQYLLNWALYIVQADMKTNMLIVI